MENLFCQTNFFFFIEYVTDLKYSFVAFYRLLKNKHPEVEVQSQQEDCDMPADSLFLARVIKQQEPLTMAGKFKEFIEKLITKEPQLVMCSLISM